MRSKLLRILAAGMLALAVPVQGLAALTGGICMAVNGHDAGHGHASAAHQHESDAHHHEDSSSHDPHSGNSHCAPCVSCCAAAAIAPTFKAVFLEAAPVAAMAPPQYWFAGVVPDKPERPPLPL